MTYFEIIWTFLISPSYHLLKPRLLNINELMFCILLSNHRTCREISGVNLRYTRIKQFDWLLKISAKQSIYKLVRVNLRRIFVYSNRALESSHYSSRITNSTHVFSHSLDTLRDLLSRTFSKAAWRLASLMARLAPARPTPWEESSTARHR